MKCGGTSVICILEKWFHLIHDYHKNSIIEPEYFTNRFDMSNITSDYCIAGHFHSEGIFIHQRYPEIITNEKELKCFTILRNPLDFVTSFYYYSKSYGRMDLSLEEFIVSNKNLIAYFMGRDETNYEVFLDRYLFIGITEKLQISIDTLADITNRKTYKVPTLNRSVKDNQVMLLTECFRKAFRRENELDYEIYSYAKNKFGFHPD